MTGSERKPRVILVGGDGRISGVPRHLRHLTAALGAKASVVLISEADQGGYDFTADQRVEHINIEGLRSRVSPWRAFRGLRELCRVLTASEADLIWLHARLPAMLIRWMMAMRLWRPHAPVAVTFHGLPYGAGYPLALSIISRLVERFICRFAPCHHLIFLNQRMADSYRQDVLGGGEERHDMHVLANCSDLGSIPIPEARQKPGKKLIMTGRASRQKDYLFAARLFAHLPADYHLTICGPGTDDPRFKADIARLLPGDILDRITFTGPLTDVRSALATADGYLLTSRYEGTPIGALEAFEAGLPIILRNFEGAEDLISLHPYSALIGSRGFDADAEEIASLLNRYERAPYAARTEIKNIWHNHWSPQIFAQNATALLDDLLSAGPEAATVQDFRRDAPARHQDRHRNEVGPLPAPPPAYKGV